MRTRILIADDEELSRRLLNAHLQEWGYDALAVCNGLDALQELQKPDPPLLAILDWMMPGLDGVQVIRELRKQSQERYVYVLLLTAKGQRKDVLEGLGSGADDYLMKPFDASELRARIKVGERILDLQRRLADALAVSEFRASHDFLTGLYNRGQIMTLLQREARRRKRENLSLGVTIADVDHFKQINDTYGHLAGDEVLKQISLRITAALRSYDFVGRYGGEEFLIITPSCEATDALEAAQRVRASIASEPIRTGQHEIWTTITLGVTAGRRHLDDLASLLHAADSALYAAKRAGRNRAELWRDLAAVGSMENTLSRVRDRDQ